MYLQNRTRHLLKKEVEAMPPPASRTPKHVEAAYLTVKSISTLCDAPEELRSASELVAMEFDQPKTANDAALDAAIVLLRSYGATQADSDLTNAIVVVELHCRAVRLLTEQVTCG